ncbi:MAG: hypothetical protein AB7P17_11565 [Nitrospirales bacterium]|nr:hypothetical protein [Nitrospirales bacterium]
MRKMIMTIATIMFVAQFSLAIGADPNIRQAPSSPLVPQQGNTIPQLQLTPDFLYQQITALEQQVASLQGQVNLLRSVIHVSQHGAAIQAENLSLNAANAINLTSGQDTNFTVGEDLSLVSGKDLLAKGGSTATLEGAGSVNLKAPQVKMNNGAKPVASLGSTVSGNKVITGSPSIFVP